MLKRKMTRSELNEELEEKDKKQIIYSAGCNLCIGLIMVGIIFGITAANSDDLDICSPDLKTWLYVYGGATIFGMVIDLIKFIIVKAGKATNKVKLVFDVIMVCLQLNFSVGLLIYGNILVYGDGKVCKDFTEGG